MKLHRRIMCSCVIIIIYIAYSDNYLIHNITWNQNVSKYGSKLGIRTIYNWLNKENVTLQRAEFSFRTKCSNRAAPPRHMFIVRHTERLDFAFKDPWWTERAFNKNGTYYRVDLNMPWTTPRRSRQFMVRDAPLTLSGHVHAWIMGDAFRSRGLSVAHVYSSPTLRVIEATSTMLRAMGLDLPINIEPGLLEWPGWFQNFQFLSMQQLQQLNLNVNSDYKAVVPVENLNYSEVRLVDEYPRCLKVAHTILDNHQKAGGDILVISHLSAIETLTRQLVGDEPLHIDKYMKVVNEQPYGVMSVVEEDCGGRHTWHRVKPPIPPTSVGFMTSYNWTYNAAM